MHVESVGRKGDPDPAGGRLGARRRLTLGLLVLALLAGAAVVLGRYMTPEAILPRLDAVQDVVRAHFWRALALFAVTYAGAVALSVPGATVFTVLGGLLFGWLWGGLASLFAASLGAVAVFLAARSLVGGPLQRLAGERIAPLAERLHADAASYLLFLRLTPVFPFWLVNIAPALLGVRLGVFAATTLVGVAPAVFAFSAAGSGLGSVVDAQKRAYEACVAGAAGPCRFDLSVQSLATPGLLAGLTALGFAALIPVALRRLGLLGGET